MLRSKILVPEWTQRQFQGFTERQFGRRLATSERARFQAAISDAYARLVQPHICRAVKRRLSKLAHDASLAVFADNLRQILLAPPLRSPHPILAIDPGFRHGCKLAVIGPHNAVLDTGLVFLPREGARSEAAEAVLRKLVEKYGVSVVAIGNGTGCRQTESLVGRVIGSSKEKKLEYCVVSEDGASTYSVTAIAAEELPDLDEKHRSAVSIGRRLRDPLSELVKVEPEHLGVGMYQHDLSGKALKETLASVVEECVSFVGVDVNSASRHLLQRVAGLNAGKAAAILKRREELGGRFSSREQLRSLKGLGPKSFQQAAGFLRVYPPASSTQPPPKKKRKASDDATWNPLDATAVHPESYESAEKLRKKVGGRLEEVGSGGLVRIQESAWASAARELELDEFVAEQLSTALCRGSGYDLRQERSGAVFRGGSSFTGRPESGQDCERRRPERHTLRRLCGRRRRLRRTPALVSVP